LLLGGKASPALEKNLSVTPGKRNFIFSSFLPGVGHVFGSLREFGEAAAAARKGPSAYKTISANTNCQHHECAQHRNAESPNGARGTRRIVGLFINREGEKIQEISAGDFGKVIADPRGRAFCQAYVHRTDCDDIDLRGKPVLIPTPRARRIRTGKAF
jgi:hypothetical protein